MQDIAPLAFPQYILDIWTLSARLDEQSGLGEGVPACVRGAGTTR